MVFVVEELDEDEEVTEDDMDEEDVDSDYSEDETEEWKLIY